MTSGLFAVLALSACNEPVEVDYKAEIETANARFEEAFKTGDIPALVGLYTEDSTIIPANMETVKGTEARTLLWKGLMDSGIAGVELVTDEVTGERNLAAERGHINLLDADGNEIATARYVVVWKKVNGIWKLHLDIWNFSTLPN
ncbi:MAG: DUF4440 domain-containing protein [Sphingomonadales bacterium]